MDDNKVYYIKRDARTKEGKDTPWLMNYKSSGLTEVNAEGQRQEVYTCLWGCHMQDAKPFINQGDAKQMAKIIGNCIVISAKKEDIS